VSGQPTQVLLIEDNPGDADFVRMGLVESNSDLQVTCADRLATGLAALALQPPAVVLLDLNLPDSRGAETFRNVLNKAPGVPVVILSANCDEELAANAVHQGVQEYLVKGAFDLKQLAHAVRFAIERQALLTALDMNRKQQLLYKDQFLSHVSHELRTPLTCAHQFVTIVLDGLAGPINSEQRDHLETALLSVNQLRTMIGGLLDATRAESGKLRIDPRCVAVGEVVQQAGTMMQGIAKTRQVSLEVSVDSRILLVSADPHRILQVLTNLIDNATKFTPPEGSVRVTAAPFEADPAFICISVADSGRGIRPEAKALIFERLYQESESIEYNRKGLGLGLYIVQELVRLHGGRIWVESRVGYGSTFSFTLPVFPLSRLLFPVLTDRGHLPNSLALVTVELSSQWTPDVGHGRDRHLELLRSCILPTKDMVLPPLGTPGQGETFWIVASADQSGANVLAQRIRERLQRSEEAKAGATFKVAVAAVQLPSPGIDKPLESLVQEVAEVISGMVQADMGKDYRPYKEVDVHNAQVGELKRRKKNGQTKNPDC
jgi:sigma-B regulation protein RsbU (phosphoserine phosphatase)